MSKYLLLVSAVPWPATKWLVITRVNDSDLHLMGFVVNCRWGKLNVILALANILSNSQLSLESGAVTLLDKWSTLTRCFSDALSRQVKSTYRHRFPVLILLADRCCRQAVDTRHSDWLALWHSACQPAVIVSSHTVSCQIILCYFI